MKKGWRVKFRLAGSYRRFRKMPTFWRNCGGEKAAAAAPAAPDPTRFAPAATVLDDGREVTLDLDQIEARYPQLRMAL